MPQNIFSTNLQSSGQPKNDAKTLFFHPPSPFPGNFCNCNSGGICTASQFEFQLPLLYTAWSNTYSEISPEVMLQPLLTSCTENYKGHSLMQTSFTELPSTLLSLVSSLYTLLSLVSSLCVYIAVFSQFSVYIAVFSQFSIYIAVFSQFSVYIAVFSQFSVYIAVFGQFSVLIAVFGQFSVFIAVFGQFSVYTLLSLVSSLYSLLFLVSSLSVGRFSEAGLLE